MNIELHNVSKITAQACHGEGAHWVDLMCEFKTRFDKPRPSVIAVFFNDAGTADTFAAAVNSVNRPPHVASNTIELMQQLRDSVALCDAERVP